MKQLYSLNVDIPEKKAYNYKILIGNNISENLQNYLNEYTTSNKFLIVTNETIYELYKNKLQIEQSKIVVLPDGEEYKNFECLQKIIDAAIAFRLERKDCMVAFGGGVIGDMTGFAAATYMRGINFIQIPTTLLAMVDSSVGGKVAINHENGKNLIGAFYQPKLVLADVSFLKTLPLRQLKTGLAEVVKYALIEKSCNAETNFELFKFLEQNSNEIYSLNVDIISELVKICCELKAAVVKQDETEKGLRAILNLGHTFAHSIENLTNYKIYTHGEAVAIGLEIALNLALKEHLIDVKYYKKTITLIKHYNITPELCNIPHKDIYNEMFLDKKSLDGKIRYIVPSNEYCVTMQSEIPEDIVINAIKDVNIF